LTLINTDKKIHIEKKRKMQRKIWPLRTPFDGSTSLTTVKLTAGRVHREFRIKKEK